jgi:hypothetical protein
MPLRLLLILSALTWHALPTSSLVSADGTPHNWWSAFRLPWSEGFGHARSSLGCPVGGGGDEDCGGHVGQNYWAIDFGTMSNHDPVKAAGGGVIYYYDYGTVSYGKWAVIWHADSWQSAYAHLCSTMFAQGTIVHQGDFIGTAGKTGNVGLSASTPRCTPGFLAGGHLHFGVYNPSQVSVNATLSNVTVGHLSDQYNTNHVSDNSGPGYVDPVNFSDYLRLKYGNLNGSPGSTWSAEYGYCGVQSRWFHNCNVYYWGGIATQNFITSGTYVSALVGGLSDIHLIWASIAKVYTYGFVWAAQGGGNWVAEWLGRPVTDEQYGCWGYPDTSCQYFQQGYIVKYNVPQPPDVHIIICNPSCWFLAAFNNIPDPGIY